MPIFAAVLDAQAGFRIAPELEFPETPRIGTFCMKAIETDDNDQPTLCTLYYFDGDSWTCIG